MIAQSGGMDSDLAGCYLRTQSLRYLPWKAQEYYPWTRVVLAQRWSKIALVGRNQNGIQRLGVIDDRAVR